ncbi:M12 family metallopeptidase [Sungkyunkwania multivorans]|uniref:M12 family metallopeptidase n=1 Tax=Sungkyunkwania multivorans TaxID=1173618 RepID=A0ABW3D1R8_9FLAO
MKTLNVINGMNMLSRILALSFLVLVSCESDIEEQVAEQNIGEEAEISEELRQTLEAEQVEFQGPKVTKVLFGTEVQVVSLGNGEYALADIILSEENFDSEDESEQNRGVWDRRVTKWPNKTILYRYSSNMPQATKDKVIYAANYITDNTDLTVRKWKSSDNAGYVWVGYSESSGCSAQLGYKNQKFPGQRMNLASGCSQGSAIHEFLHVAGIIHEQNHWNRDAYVEVLWSNILDDKEFNYFKVSDANGWEISDVLDTNSIMMYGSYFFRTPQAISNGWRSMRRVDGSTIVPNRSYMTSKDIQIINAVY